MTEAGEKTLAPAAPRKTRLPALSRRAAVVLAVAAVVLLTLGGLLLLGKNAPPEAARLLPESDGVVYVDAAPLRAVAGFQAHPVKRDPDYQRFIDATGVEFERDLNEAAFAAHHMPNPLGPNGAVAFSSIFVGRFDRQRLASYFAGKAQSEEQYDGHTIYNIPMQGRTDRVAILNAHTVAVSNTPTAEQIHSILDRQRTAFLPFSGNSLLTRYYKEVPLFSLVWGMGKLTAGIGDDITFLGLRIPLSIGATFIGSMRWAGALRVRVEEIAPTGPAATLSADSIEALLSVARSAEKVMPDAITSPDTRALLDSVAIEHHNDRAVLTATVPLELLKKLAVAPDGR